MDDGKIKSCPKNGCNYHCCDFNQNNYIVLFPNELNHMIKNNEIYSHLTIIENLEQNSHKVICKASNRENCDNGYKPIDCKIYPIFPTKNKKYYLKGVKCPLSNSELKEHLINCESLISNLDYCTNKELGVWFNKIELVGYKKIKTHHNNGNRCTRI